jgi:hypothetical protein
MEYKVVSTPSPEGLTRQVNELILNGWKPVGSHRVVETHRQNRYSGTQHMDTIIKTEYSQTMIK